jgi:hypothetical protein
MRHYSAHNSSANVERPGGIAGICDIHVLIDAGIMQQTDEGVVFPYDAVRIEATLLAAAE